MYFFFSFLSFLRGENPIFNHWTKLIEVTFPPVVFFCGMFWFKEAEVENVKQHVFTFYLTCVLCNID